MAKFYCKYHPKDLARKYCPHCKINLCSKCIKPESRGSDRYICPVCKNEVNDLGMENVITPFWECIPQFFKYPFNMDSIIYMIALSIIGSIMYGIGLALLSLSGSIASLVIGITILHLCITFAILRYGFALLQQSSRGYITPEETSGKTKVNTSSNMHITFFMVAILLAIWMGIVVIVFKSPTLITLFTILYALTLPAIIMTVGITENFSQSINPLAWFVIIKSIGFPYLALLFFLSILYGGEGVFLYYVMPHVYPLLILPIYILTSTYFSMVMFLMMGYVLYQYHERIGFTVAKDIEEDGINPMHSAEDITTSVLQEVSILVQEGMFEEAKDKLKQTLIRHSMELKLHDQYHKLLVKTNDKANLTIHTKAYIPALISNGQLDQTVNAVEQALKFDKNFRPENSIHTIAIAQQASTKGKHKLALQILDKFDQFYQMDSNIPKAGLLMCKALCDGLGEDAKSKKILQVMLNKYPDGEIADEMREYMKFVDSLLGTTPT